MRRTARSSALLRAGLLLPLLASSMTLHAATCTWTGNGTDALWSTAANWNNCAGAHPLPIDGDILLFATAGLRQANQNNIAGLDLAELRFTGGTYNIFGSSLTLANGIQVSGTTGATSATVTMPLTLTAAQPFACTGTNTLRLNGAVALGSFPLAIDGTCQTTFAGAISGSGTLAKLGTGTLVMLSGHTYTGATNIIGGTVEAWSDTALGTAAGGTTVGNNATLTLRNGRTLAEPLVLNGSGGSGNGAVHVEFVSSTLTGPVTLGSTAVLDVDGAVTLSIDGSIGGSAGLVKTGTGTLVLSSANTHTGITQVAGGVLLATHPGALGPGGSTDVLNGATLALVGVAPAGETLLLNGPGAVGNGALRAMSGPNAWNGPITLGGTATIQVDNAAELLFSGAIGGTALAKTGPGRLTLAGTNTYAGTTTVNDGVLRVQSSQALGTSAGVTVVAQAAQLELDGSIDTGENFVLNGQPGNPALRSFGAANQLRGDVTFGGEVTLEVPAPADVLTLRGTASGGGSLVKSGAGTLTLAGSNTYVGVTRVDAGTLRAQSDTALGSSGAPTEVASSSVLEFGGGFTTSEPLLLRASTTVVSRGGAHVALGDVTLDGVTLIDVDGGTLTLGAPVSGAGAIFKSGDGTLALNSPNTYAGKTTVAEGTLQLAGDTGDIDVTAGAALNGGGRAALVTLLPGGLIAPTGTLELAALTWHGGGALAFEVGGLPGGADLLQIGGALLKGPGSGFEFRFTDSATGEPVPDVAYVLARYASTTFAANDFSHTYFGAPGASSLVGAFFVLPDRLEFEALSVSLFQDGFE